MRRNRATEKTLRIKGVGLVDVVTTTGLARLVGKSRDTILRYERTDVFPLAPIMVGDKRYYPLSLARRLAPIVGKLPNGKKPDAELIVEIHRLFKDEKTKLICQQQKQ